MKSFLYCYLETSRLQTVFKNLVFVTSDDFRSPFTFTKTNGLNVRLLSLTHLHAKYEKHPWFLHRDIVWTRFSVFGLWWPHMAIDLHQIRWAPLSLNMIILYPTYENYPALLSWDMVTTSQASQAHINTFPHLHTQTISRVIA